MQLITKISTKTVIGGKSAILEAVMKDKEASVPVMRIIGIASGMKSGESDNGPWIAVTGQFKATNLLTGEEFRSGKCFLPSVAGDLVIGALMSEGAKSVNLAFDITAMFDESSATSYVYGATPLIETTESDPIALLEKQLSGTPALEDKSKHENEEKHSESGKNSKKK